MKLSVDSMYIVNVFTCAIYVHSWRPVNQMSGQRILENPYYYDPSSLQYQFGNCDQ